MRWTIAAPVLVVGLISAGSAWPQAPGPDGAEVFQRSCASCHAGVSGSRAPGVDALRPRAPQAILESLVNGAMRVQGARLSGAERRAVAEYLTGKSIDVDVAGTGKGRCTAVAPPRTSSSATWQGWSPTITNTRFQASDQARLGASDVRRLTLRWAFGFPDAASAWAQPTVFGGRVFVGSQNGTVYSLDAKTGCIYWTFAAQGGVRTALAVGASPSGGTVFFGDTAANAYALDASTGRSLWMKRIDDHPLARITGSPAVYGDRVYVPVSSYEEAQGVDPEYSCCTFRGSVTAMDARTGAVVWKTYTIPDQPVRRGTSTTGVALWGPAGAAIWSAPTIDLGRRTLYVATGNSYSAPAAPTSDAIVAISLDTGTIRWSRQLLANDIYITGCRPGVANPNCPAVVGPDLDFGSPAILARRADNREVLIVGQKSGVAFALDPDKNGEIMWQYRAGEGGVLGGIEWGSAVDGQQAYFAVSDIMGPKPGGLHAVSLTTGEPAWVAPPAEARCGTIRGCNAAQSAAVTAIDGFVFSGSNDGVLRAYGTRIGDVVWEFDTNREFAAVNGVPAKGASMIGPGAAVADGMVYVNSGYGAFGGRAGNVLLAFGVE